jgi:imidazolonepropionase-like amidohydrolase
MWRSSSSSAFGVAAVAALAAYSAILFLGQPVEVLAQANETALYEGARVIVGDGSAPIENAAILVENGKFTVIGPRGQVQAPAGAARVDLTGKTIIPTFVNAHQHIGPGRGSPAFFDMQAGRQAYIQQLHVLAYGGTAAATSMGWDTEAALQIRAEYFPNAARLLTSYRGAGVPLGQVKKMQEAHSAGRDTRMDEDLSDSTVWLWTKTQAEIYVQEQAYKRVDFIKLWVDDRLGTELHLSPDVYRPLIERAHQHDIPVFAHMFYQADAKDLALAGIDMLAHPVRDSVVDDEFVRIMRDHHVVQQTNFQLPWSYTMADADASLYWEDPLFLETSSPTAAQRYREQARTRASIVRTHEGQLDVDGRKFNEEIYQRIVANLKKEYAGGVKIAVGTDGGGTFAPHLDMRLLVKDVGLTPMQAITVATKNAAEALDLDDLGTVQAGKDASFVVLNANPLDDIKNTAKIADVYLKGHKVDRQMIKKTYLARITAPPAGPAPRTRD